MADNKKYYWLKLMNDFFTQPRIKKLRRIAGGDTYTIIYLKMQLLSLKNDGVLIFEGIEDDVIQELALTLDEEEDDVSITFQYLLKQGLIEQIDQENYLMTETQYLIGSETASAARVRKHRERKLLTEALEEKKVAKSNALRQKQHRAKKKCEEKQHIPYIEDHQNNKRYNGNYYVVIQRDKYKCALCGSIENLCVHHIDGYDEGKPQNSSTNKMLTLCRSCHSNVHAGQKIDEDTLDAIDYYAENNELLPSNTFVTICNTEIEIEKDKEIDKEKEKEKEVEKKSDDSTSEPTQPPILTLLLNTKEEYPIYQIDIEAWQDLYPAVDIMTELRKMKGWLMANPAKRKTKKGILRFVNSWLAKEQDRPHYNKPSNPVDPFENFNHADTIEEAPKVSETEYLELMEAIKEMTRG